LDPATSILLRAIPRDKDFPALYGTLADIYFQRGDYVKALETALSCIDRNPNFSYCYVIATKVQYNDGAFEKAAQSAERAAELGSPETSVYYYGGEAYYKLNRCPEAIKLLGAGVQLATKLNKESARSDFVDALSRCGVTAEIQILPTATPFLVTATPRPRK
jgi:tetratricopeptide (TPR) repeat protein